MIHVTAHALDRALQRIPGLKSEREALSILTCAAVSCAARFAPCGSIYVRIASGNRIAMEDGAVVTVLPVEINMRKLSSDADRYRRFCRAYNIAHWNRGH